jgi:hypothetical protein
MNIDTEWLKRNVKIQLIEEDHNWQWIKVYIEVAGEEIVLAEKELLDLSWTSTAIKSL